MKHPITRVYMLCSEWAGLTSYSRSRFSEFTLW